MGLTNHRRLLRLTNTNDDRLATWVTEVLVSASPSVTVNTSALLHGRKMRTYHELEALFQSPVVLGSTVYKLVLL